MQSRLWNSRILDLATVNTVSSGPIQSRATSHLLIFSYDHCVCHDLCTYVLNAFLLRHTLADCEKTRDLSIHKHLLQMPKDYSFQMILTTSNAMASESPIITPFKGSSFRSWISYATFGTYLRLSWKEAKNHHLSPWPAKNNRSETVSSKA